MKKNTHGTLPDVADTDADGLSDGDSFGDGVEVEGGLDPLVPAVDIGPNGERLVVLDGGSGSGWYLPGTNVAIIAERRDGFYFSHWTGDREVLADFRDALPSFIMPDRNISLTANPLDYSGTARNHRSRKRPESLLSGEGENECRTLKNEYRISKVRCDKESRRDACDTSRRRPACSVEEEKTLYGKYEVLR